MWTFVCSLVLAVTIAIVFANAQTDVPDEDSNYSVQTGMLTYLPSYFTTFIPTVGIVAGKAALVRKARQAQTVISVAFGAGPSGGSIPDPTVAEFKLVLHSAQCDQGDGGAVYQHPFLCESGCTSSAVDAAKGSAMPLEVEFTATLDISSSPAEADVEFIWNVHIPDTHNGQSRTDLSLVLYDPVHDVPMLCADLVDDRVMDGLVYFVDEALVDFVPSVRYRSCKTFCLRV